MKDCLIIGPDTALHYKDVYPLLKDKILTVKDVCIHFSTDPNCPKGRWFSTLNRAGINIKRRQLTKTYNPDDYPRFDNYDAIASKSKDIPVDYTGLIAVPLTYFKYADYLPYEIVDKTAKLELNGKRLFERLIIRRKN